MHPIEFRCCPLFVLAAALVVAIPAAMPRTERSVRDEISSRLPWRLVGPAHMGGRITDIAVPAQDPYTIYVGAATGGVWKTTNNGTTWTPVFDSGGRASIGDIAVASSDPKIIWVGTGEANASSYSSWGDGVYKSIDAGRTWIHMGLRETHHIGRVVIDPRDPTIVYVAALGHLWGANNERGLFKTTDGGASWTRSLFISEDAGVADLAIDPVNPRVLYAAAYGRRARRFDDFDSMGIDVRPGSGLYKSTDAGATWTRLDRGLPHGRIGRIGIAIAPSRPSVVYAIVERAPFQITLGEMDLARVKALLDRDSDPGPDVVREIATLVSNATPASERSGAVIAGLSRAEQLQVRALVGQGELDTGGGLFRSEDRGATWIRMHPFNERGAYYSQVRVDPTNPDRVYVLLVRTWTADDGGRSLHQTNWAFSSGLSSSFIHGDFHAMWIDPSDPRHMIVGSDGGLYRTFDRGEKWESHPLPIGQFVGIAVDMRQPYFIYGGLQDNGCWGGPSATRHVAGVTDSDWFKVVSSDGAYVQVDPHDFNTVYTEWQYAAISRTDLRTGARKSIRPRDDIAPAPLRFNYVAPYLLSPHDSNVIYLGAQHLLRSADRGDTWARVSPDLTKHAPDPLTGEGATMTTVAQSPLNAAVLWAGTDDGNLQVTRDGGTTWANVADRIPDLRRTNDHTQTWVSRVEASHFDVGTAYASFDAHRDDDFGAYVYSTSDYGQTWRSIAGDLPAGVPVNVVREDLKNPDLLFVGTETGVFLSLDRGAHWVRAGSGLPTVPVDDLVIHPRDGDLIAGTHGRGVFILDIVPLEQFVSKVTTASVHLFAPRPAVLLGVDVTRNKGASGARPFVAKNPYSDLVTPDDSSGMAPPGATFYVWRTGGRGPMTIQILDSAASLVRELATIAEPGLTRVPWDLRKSPLPLPPDWKRVGGNDSRALLQAARSRPGPLVTPGEYQIVLRIGDQMQRQTLRVEPDRP